MEKNTKESGKVRLKSGGNTDMRPQDHGGSLNTGGDHERTGRPRKLPALDEILAKVLSEEQDGMTVAEGLIRALYVQAVNGNTGAAKLLLERSYGLMKHTIDMNTAPSQAPDLSAFTDDELRQYIAIMEKIGTKPV